MHNTIGNTPPESAEPHLGTRSPSSAIKNEWRSRGYLPHLDRIGLLQSITIRLADSLPQEKLRELDEELEKMKKKEEDAELGLRAPRVNAPRVNAPRVNAPDIKRRKQIEAWLDSGMGCCALGHPQMAAVMQETLLKFDEQKYLLLAWCIMPNHVHVLIEPKQPLSAIVRSWKSFTGRWAMKHNAELGLGIPEEEERENAELGLRAPRVHAPKGFVPRFWMPDYWDRYIRDEKHLCSVIDYIHNNPVKAGLCQKENDWLWSSAYVNNQ